MRSAALTLSLLAGCGTPWIETIDGNWRRLATTARSGSAGSLRVTVDPGPVETSMLVTIEPEDPAIDAHVRTLQIGGSVPFRADTEVNSDRAKTNAGYIGHVVTMNWPVLELDGPLQPVTHKLGIGLVDTGLAYTKGTARVSVLLKADPDTTRGRLGVNVVFAGATAQDGGLVRATEEAVEIWRQIYVGVGIELDVTWFDFAGPGALQVPGQGDAEIYHEIADSTGFGGVNLVIAEDIVGFSDLFGFAGGIPGPLVPTELSAVVVSAAMAGGTDGQFNPREVQLLAETMAHEVGHSLGLYHPVETTFTSWDALDDTPECDAEFACKQALGTNLMYPTPVCDGVGCLLQIDLSEEQGGVANRYTGVL